MPVPRRSQYAFNGYRASNSSSGALRIDADGSIVAWNAGTSTTELKIYSRWTLLSVRLYLKQPTSSTIQWVTPDPEFYRAVDGGDIYRDDQLTDGPIFSIRIPYCEKYAYQGAWYVDSSDSSIHYDCIDKDGTLLDYLRTMSVKNAMSDNAVSVPVKWKLCYKATLDANGGSGGEANPIWYDQVHDRWCSDAYLLDVITSVSKPTLAGKAFTGYYTAKSGGTQVVDGTGRIKDTWTTVTSANATVYAQWESPVAVTFDHGGGSGTVDTLYYCAGSFFASSALADEVAAVAPPTRANHRFLGYYSDGAEVVAADGAISPSWSPSSAVTATAQWERVSYTVRIEANGGDGVSAVFADAARTGLYADETCAGDALTGVRPPVRAGYRFLGLYDADTEGGTLLADGDGTFTDSMASFVASVDDDSTLYALWKHVVTVRLDHRGGESDTDAVYYDADNGLFYDSAEMDAPAGGIAAPARECHAFGGYYTEADGGGEQRIDAGGAVVAGYAPAQDETLYAKWTRRSYRYGLNAAGGTAGASAIYCNGVDATFYADDALEMQAVAVAVPTRPGHSFGGYADGDVQVVDASGEIVLAEAFAADMEATAAWTANVYILSFDYSGGDGDVPRKSVTFGQAIGALPDATRARASFAGWALDGGVVDDTTVWSVPGDATAVAQWDLEFGGATDYFSVGNPALVTVSSTSGDECRRVAVAHGGKYEAGVNEAGGTWRNPSVTYAVKADTTVSVRLGQAFAAERRNGVMTRSGYMITAVEIRTEVGRFPTVTISATANEGENAVNNFAVNAGRFNVSVPVVARSRAQNLLGAISGGGHLQRVTLLATCDPVVCEENMMPCASDIVNGRYELDAETVAPADEAAPTASSGFAAIGTPVSGMDGAYRSYAIKARKEMV